MRGIAPREFCYDAMPHIDSCATIFKSSPVGLVDTAPRTANGNPNRLINTCTLPCLATSGLPAEPSIEPTLDRNLNYY